MPSFAKTTFQPPIATGPMELDPGTSDPGEATSPPGGVAKGPGESSGGARNRGEGLPELVPDSKLDASTVCDRMRDRGCCPFRDRCSRLDSSTELPWLLPHPGRPGILQSGLRHDGPRSGVLLLQRQSRRGKQREPLGNSFLSYDCAPSARLRDCSLADHVAVSEAGRAGLRRDTRVRDCKGLLSSASIASSFRHALSGEPAYLGD